MQRVMSQESNGSANTATPPATAPSNLIAPISTNLQPSSPASGSAGVSTPKARQARLSAEGGLAQDLEELQVRSPMAMAGMDPPTPIHAEEGDVGMADGSGHGHERSYSGSTESSSFGSFGQLPSQFGSVYGAEGFATAPSHVSPYNYNMPKTDSPEFSMTPAAAAAIAAADEAIKQLNGTSTVYQGYQGVPSIPGPQPLQPPGTMPLENPYQLPRGYANFVKPQNKDDPAGVSRQSSTSSSTTEASTSSEESDLCIPRIEWVDKDVGVGAGTPQSWANGFFTPYQPHRIAPARMPPPASTNRVSSPRNKNLASPTAGPSQPALPVGASAHTPSGLGQSSALPTGIAPEAMDEDDDDQTIGQRDKSPTSDSSHSSQSGLDLLLRAVTHSSNGKDMGEDHAPAPALPQSPPVHEGKGKRKAGSEAVDQWRNSGIPTGVGAKGKGAKPEVPLAGPPSKKRRRSSAVDEETHIDPSLRDDGGQVEHKPHSHAQTYAPLEEEMEEESSEPDDGASEGDSEYGGDGKVKKGGAGAARGRGGAKRAVRGRGSASHNATAGSSKGGTPAASGGKRGKKTDSPSAAVKGARRESAAAQMGIMVANGVQCDYTNPLPPYNRCQDVFTRKYDLPRHMARHARREGELVYEGKLAADKALLWATIKDRPKVSCEHCGESFTRMDALKRHQAKQHH
ncbi:uncharacterized protein MKK02DRAFT_21684 [Dioszegia hungarica]|uniref:C2H2-type domain-containing protein n=1 Tax=Dioszegia hungarica TaxID=4972 RepID=A0AA38HGZ5_9TREE|nr:uncharacterized protein MKK02DRAFT_21684 [Dioszegia hungarica]KAI9638829.1 hypothetical protein MKK02DRAFT_21684 [Dioszegia hungarica]